MATLITVLNALIRRVDAGAQPSVIPPVPSITDAVTYKGNPAPVSGEFPKIHQSVKPFTLTGNDFENVNLGDFTGKRKVLHIVLSVDTPVCDRSLRKLNEIATRFPDTVMLGISADLPFTQKRFCNVAGLDQIIILSTFQSSDFGRDYGVAIVEGPLARLTARAVIVLDQQNRVLHGERVREIANEPDNEKVLNALQ